LEKIDEWSTHGMDPHELLTDADGSLAVANGGRGQLGIALQSRRPAAAAGARSTPPP